MEFFFNWMAKPLNPEDVDAWFRANNIIPEYSELFKDFCFSLLFLIKDTYLGDSHGDSKETKIGFMRDYLNQAEANGIDTKNIVVDKNISTVLKNINKLWVCKMFFCR